MSAPRTATPLPRSNKRTPARRSDIGSAEPSRRDGDGQTRTGNRRLIRTLRSPVAPHPHAPMTLNRRGVPDSPLGPRPAGSPDGQGQPVVYGLTNRDVRPLHQHPTAGEPGLEPESTDLESVVLAAELLSRNRRQQKKPPVRRLADGRWYEDRNLPSTSCTGGAARGRICDREFPPQVKHGYPLQTLCRHDDTRSCEALLM